MTRAGQRGFLIALLSAGMMGAGLSGCLFIPDNDTHLEDIFPLAIGNTWTYVDSTRYTPDSVVTGSHEVTIPGTRELVIEGKPVTAFRVNNHEVGGPLSSLSTYVINIGHSNYNLGAELDTAQVTGKALHLEYPTAAGRRYPTVFFGFRAEGSAWIPTRDTITIEAVDPHHSCTTPAGTFPCVVFRGYNPDGSLFATAYHAPGIGYLGYDIARTERVGDSLREVTYTRRLTSYTLH